MLPISIWFHIYSQSNQCVTEMLSRILFSISHDSMYIIIIIIGFIQFYIFGTKYFNKFPFPTSRSILTIDIEWLPVRC